MAIRIGHLALTPISLGKTLTSVSCYKEPSAMIFTMPPAELISHILTCQVICSTDGQEKEHPIPFLDLHLPMLMATGCPQASLSKMAPICVSRIWFLVTLFRIS